MRVCFLLLLTAVLSTACVVKQSPLEPSASSTGPFRFTGTINTVSGERIAGARLTILDGPNKDAQAATDASGSYVFANLDSGTFNLRIEAPGFNSITLRVDLFRDMDVNFALASVS
jgi:hypothetical protein